MNSPNFDPSKFDPSKMDPRLLMELSQLIQKLPPEKLGQMQTIMHNMMAGFDVTQQMQELERSFPPGFREKLISLMTSQGMGSPFESPSNSSSLPPAQGGSPVETQLSDAEQAQMNVQEARLTILRAVADGRMTPEQAEKLL